ncbi:5704_t:CDS:1, partial [Dentiscutata erythropus]
RNEEIGSVYIYKFSRVDLRRYNMSALKRRVLRSKKGYSRWPESYVEVVLRLLLS